VEYGIAVEEAMSIEVRDSLHEANKQLRSRGDVMFASSVGSNGDADLGFDSQFQRNNSNSNSKRAADDIILVARNDSNSSGVSASSNSSGRSSHKTSVHPPGISDKLAPGMLFASNSSNALNRYLTSVDDGVAANSESLLKLPSVTNFGPSVVGPANSASSSLGNNSPRLPAVAGASSSSSAVPTAAPLLAVAATVALETTSDSPKVLTKKKAPKSARFVVVEDEKEPEPKRDAAKEPQVSIPVPAPVPSSDVVESKPAIVSESSKSKPPPPKGPPPTNITKGTDGSTSGKLTNSSNSNFHASMDRLNDIHKKYEEDSDDEEDEGSSDDDSVEDDDSEEDNDNENHHKQGKFDSSKVKGTPVPKRRQRKASKDASDDTDPVKSASNPSNTSASSAANSSTREFIGSVSGRVPLRTAGTAETPGVSVAGTNSADAEGSSLFDYDWLSQLRKAEIKDAAAGVPHEMKKSLGTTEDTLSAAGDQIAPSTAEEVGSNSSPDNVAVTSTENDVENDALIEHQHQQQVRRIRRKQAHKHHHNDSVRMDIEDSLEKAIEDIDDESATDTETDNDGSRKHRTHKSHTSSDRKIAELDTDEEEEIENAKQVRSLRRHVHVLIEIGDVKGAEQLLERCLELNPLEIRTLRAFAMFLHRKKGELARAEAFFRRASQVSGCAFDFWCGGLIRCLDT
jgi:hypothetical protein